MITLIWAETLNGAIGKDNKLIYKSNEDMKFFKKTTINHTVVMGRKNFESIGNALPQRNNIILTRDEEFHAKDCLVVNSVNEVLELAKNEEIFIIGGNEIYELFLPYADILLRTIFQVNQDGDTYAPKFDKLKFNLEAYTKRVENNTSIHFYQYRRNNK